MLLAAPVGLPLSRREIELVLAVLLLAHRDGSGGSDDGGDGESIEALVEVQGQVHEVSVKLADCASFADLSQRVHEACEDAGLPALPLNGLMHMVLSIDGKPVPVTRSTQFARLADAERLRVTIGADPATRKPSSNVGAKKGRK